MPSPLDLETAAAESQWVCAVLRSGFPVTCGVGDTFHLWEGKSWGDSSIIYQHS